MQNFELENLEFNCTPRDCSEQYEVMQNGKYVAYIKLKFGRLTCQIYDGKMFGEILSQTIFADKTKSVFLNEDEKLRFLEEFAESIKKYYQKNMCNIKEKNIKYDRT